MPPNALETSQCFFYSVSEIAKSSSPHKRFQPGCVLGQRCMLHAGSLTLCLPYLDMQVVVGSFDGYIKLLDEGGQVIDLGLVLGVGLRVSTHRLVNYEPLCQFGSSAFQLQAPLLR